MPRIFSEARVTLSVLDRLLDFEPDVSREAPASRTKNLRVLKQAVRRDLEWLFNSRYVATVPADLEEAQRSVAVYGLPDFSSMSIKNPDDQERLLAAIEKAIECFEPRLESITVTAETDDAAQRGVHFRIHANLIVDPAPEPVVFDTIYHSQYSEFRVKGE